MNVVYDGARVVINPEFIHWVRKNHRAPGNMWWQYCVAMANEGVELVVSRHSDHEHWRLDPIDGRDHDLGLWYLDSSGMGDFKIASGAPMPVVLPSYRKAFEDALKKIEEHEEVLKKVEDIVAKNEKEQLEKTSEQKPVDEKERIMSETTKDLLKNVLEPVKDGAKMAGSAEAAELMVRTFHMVLRKSKPDWASVLGKLGDEFQHLQAAVLAAGVKLAVSVWPNLPQAETAKQIADMALRFESAVVLKPLFGHISEFVEALVSGGSSFLATKVEE